jgi:hypothetical protein
LHLVQGFRDLPNISRDVCEICSHSLGSLISLLKRYDLLQQVAFPLGHGLLFMLPLTSVFTLFCDENFAELKKAEQMQMLKLWGRIPGSGKFLKPDWELWNVIV